MHSIPALPTTSFSNLPEDILIQISQFSSLSATAALGRSSKQLYATLNASLYPAHLHLHHSYARSLPFSPPPQDWPSPDLLSHITQTSHRVTDTHSFHARALPLPSPLTAARRGGFFTSTRGLGSKSLLAVDRTRIVATGVGGRRGVLVVYDLMERGEGEGRGQMRIGDGWEVSFGSDVGLRRDAPEAGNGRSSQDDGEPVAKERGLGGLLSADLTGMEFCSGRHWGEAGWDTTGDVDRVSRVGEDMVEEGDGEENLLVLTFGNGVVQIVRLPKGPSSSSTPPEPPVPPPTPKPTSAGRRRPHKNQHGIPSDNSAHSTPPIPTLTLVKTLSHLPSPIQSLSVSAPSSTSSSHLLTASYSGLISLYSSPSSSSSSSSPSIPLSTFQLPSPASPTNTSIKPWSTYLSSSLSYILLGTSSPSSPLSFHSLTPSGDVLPSSRSLAGPVDSERTTTTTPSVYAIDTLGGREDLVLSCWSTPVGAVCMHDLRIGGAVGVEGSADRPVLVLKDRWVEGESWYSVAASETGQTIFAGLATGNRIGIWDVRSPAFSLSLSSLSLDGGQDGSSETFSFDPEKGWTVFAPTGSQTGGGGKGSGGGGEVGGLEWVGGRLWGVTPSAPFILDFSPPSSLCSSLFPSPSSSVPSTQTNSRSTKMLTTGEGHSAGRRGGATLQQNVGRGRWEDEGGAGEEPVVTFYDHTEAMELGKSERLLS